jgi:hypothetical protein
MGMLLRRRNATVVKEGKTTKVADVTPVAKPEVEKKATKTKKAEKPEA